jgi:pimeloyl-ACP methyl ester carboxylesterase
MSSGVHYQPIIDDLLEKYRVIIPDMRGFGDSTYNTPINSLEDLGKDIIEIMDSLNINSYFLAGWSTGGGIALKIASLVPTRVRKIILIESCSYRGYPIFQKDQNNQPLLGVHYQTKEEMAKDPVQVLPMVQIFETKNKPFINAVWDQLIYTVNKPTKEENDLFLDETLKQRNLVDIDWALVTFNMSDTFNGVAEGDQSIKDVTCPVLSIWSEKDVVVLEYMIDETVAALKDCKKVVLKDSGHSPLVDKPKELTNLIIDFL